MLLGVCLFSFGDALGKYIVATYSVGQLMLLRAVASLVLLSPLIWRSRAHFTRIERPGLQVLRVVLSTRGGRRVLLGRVLSCRWRMSSPIISPRRSS